VAVPVILSLPDDRDAVPKLKWDLFSFGFRGVM